VNPRRIYIEHALWVEHSCLCMFLANPTILYFYDPLKVINVEFLGHAAMPRRWHSFGHRMCSSNKIWSVEFHSASSITYHRATTCLASSVLILETNIDPLSPLPGVAWPPKSGCHEGAYQRPMNNLPKTISSLSYALYKRKQTHHHFNFATSQTPSNKSVDSEHPDDLF
jgi:hypothetical protein